MQRQARGRQTARPLVGSMNNHEIETFLGQQYADLVKENNAGIYRDCEEVIQGSLKLLEAYNRINLAIKTKHFGGILG